MPSHGGTQFLGCRMFVRTLYCACCRRERALADMTAIDPRSTHDAPLVCGRCAKRLAKIAT